MATPIALDSAVVHGLMTKVKEVFSHESTFLTFPLSPIAFHQDHLRFTEPGGLDAEGLRAFVEFSLLANSVPDGEDWTPTEQKLWHVLSAVLGPDVELAASGRSSEEENVYQAALDVITDIAPDGFRIDSLAMKRYRQHRDDVFAAQQAFNDVSSRMPSDAAETARWKDELLACQARLDDAQTEWVTLGEKEEIERAKNLVLTLGDKAPAVTWARHRQLFDPSQPEITYAHDPNLGRFMETGFAPSDAIETSWARLTLTGAELVELARQGPLPQPREVDQPEEGVLEVSFEYTSVSLVRPWLDASIFDSRCWRFRESSRMLSDGRQPANGECTGYSCAVVFARNIAITRPSQPPSAPPATMQVSPSGPLPLDVLGNPSVIVDAFGLPAMFAASPLAVTTNPMRVETDLSEEERTVVVEGGRRRQEPNPVAASIDDLLPPSVDTTMRLRLEARPQLSLLRSLDFRRLPRPVPEPPTPGPPGHAVITPAEEIFVLAFVCKRVPQAPYPDTTLRWG